MPTTYEIDRVADLLRVPIERRTACLREVEYALALHELAFGEKAADVEIGPMRWTDDGDKTCTLHDASGKPVLTLEVTSKSDMQPNGCTELLGGGLHLATGRKGDNDEV